MNRYYLMFFFSLMFFGSGCSGSEVISGSTYEYKVPAKFISDTGSSLFPKTFEADRAKSLSLMVVSEDIQYFSGVDPFEMSVLVFLDREYNHQSVLRADSKVITDEAERVSCLQWTACYRREWAGEKSNYYLTFDPDDSKPTSQDDGDYVFTVKSAGSLPIGNMKGRGKATCSFHQVIDGMLIQVATSGAACSQENISALPKGVQTLFAEWRVASGSAT